MASPIPVVLPVTMMTLSMSCMKRPYLSFVIYDEARAKMALSNYRDESG